MDNIQTIGDYLKSKRLNAKLSVLDVAEKTKINKNVLEFLEDSNFSKLPSKTYVRGFVINYAKALHLNVDEALHVLENHYPKKEKTEAPETSQKPKEEVAPAVKEIFWFTQTLLKKEVIISFFAIVFVIFIALKLNSINKEIKSNDEQTESAAEAPAPAEQLATSQEIKQQDVSLFDLDSTKKMREEILSDQANQVKTEIKPETTDTTPVKASEQPSLTKIVEVKKEEVVKEEIKKEEIKTVEVKKEEPVRNDLPAKNPKLFPYVEFKPANNIKYNFNESAKELNDPNILPTNIKAAMVAGRENVFINSHTGDTWLTYKVDDQKIKRFVLRQGRTLFLKGQKIVLFLGTRDTAKVFYNKKLVDISSDSGSRSLVFPTTKSSDYYLPLFQTGKDGISYLAQDYQLIMDSKPQ